MSGERARPLGGSLIAQWCIGMIILAGEPAWGADVRILDLHHDDNRYYISLEARIQAPPAAVFSVITDYDRIRDLHRRVKESRVISRIDARTTEVFTRLRGCIAALFCRTIRRVERVTESPPDGLDARVVPEKSDFSFGEVRWRLTDTDEGTLLRYESEMVPDFWIPAILGDALVARSIERTTMQMIRSVEKLAQQSSVGGGEPWKTNR